MRTVVAVAFLCGVSAPCMAQEMSPNFLKKEPYFLSPWSVVYVDNGTCGVGKVMKVTGAIGALRRKKVCVPMGPEQASRTFATP
ncbi:hypothetical protein HNQ36_001245 [Afipia massiliensis]|uniref:Porin n=1 Tax=Afipia massiliensis TaxID=211460 RepID=A0A840N098_9BRAD|nr:hypothetical protein [Afipia massiliensis]MBB5051291.1 hypothetical protein [Afipia massiliensis]